MCKMSSIQRRVARFSQNKTHPISTQNSPKLAQWHFEGGPPVKIALQGLNITLFDPFNP